MKMSIFICIFLSIYCNKSNSIIYKAAFKSYNSDYVMNKKRSYNINNLFKMNLYQIRKLIDDNNNKTNNTNNNITTTIINDKERNNQNIKKNSGIGWLGTIIIIILSIVVIYVLYTGFRYYKRKKYQNPSFYYKITEEMFEDITPIE